MSSGTANTGALLEVEHAVGLILADAERLGDVAAALLAAIAEPLGCQLGGGWRVRDDSMEAVEVWSDGSLADDDVAAMYAIGTMKPGEGLPGRVWNSGQAAWVVDVTADRNFPRRRPAAAAGLRSAFCFPIVSERMGITGALEFFTRERLDPDVHLLATVASLGRRMGAVVDRTLATRDLRSSEALNRAILEAALDCVVTMDAEGKVVEFNPAAQRTFGYSRDEVIGRDMADLIVPPHLRDRHRRGLKRYLTTGEGMVLDHRLELSALRHDGSEFPVELAITRINLPGPPLFTGHIRDITDRKRSEEELRASRALVLEAADAERRRIERDLHDGAQQRLVALALNLRLTRNRLESDPAGAAALLDGAVDELHGATAELRELARGIHPAILTDRGLAEALGALAARAPVPVRLPELAGDRLPGQVEAAIYFVVAESLTNMARHAGASEAEVRIERDADTIAVEVADDGAGGADPLAGSGLRGLSDRLATLDGELTVRSAPGEGTTVRAVIPCRS